MDWLSSFLKTLKKFWVVVAGFVTVASYASYQFGHIKFDADLNKLVGDTAALKAENKSLKLRLKYLTDSLRIVNPPLDTNELVILRNGNLTSGFDMGADTHDHIAGWVKKVADAQIIDYPGNQDWGTVFITVGRPSPMGQRSFENFSRYKRISFEINAAVGNRILVGLKSNTDPDYGSETKYPIAILKSGWNTYSVEIKRFTSADLTHLYVVTEFVFGELPQKLSVRNVKFLK